jgi:RNA polymerase sigma factor (sigma-70 family)
VRRGKRVLLTDEVLQQLESWLRARARGSGLGASIADDLAADAMLRLLVANASKEIRDPFAYAAQILRNLVRDRIRELERAARAMEVLVRRCPDSIEPEDEAVETEDVVRYLMENAGLSKLQLEVVCLVFLEGLPVSDAAARLSRNPGTVHHHLERALTKLATRAASLRIHP